MFNKTTEFEIPEVKVNKKVTNKSAFQENDTEELNDGKKSDNTSKKINVSSEGTQGVKGAQGVKGNKGLDININNLTAIEVEYLKMLKDMMKKSSKNKILSQIKSMSEGSLKISKTKLIKLLDSL